MIHWDGTITLGNLLTIVVLLYPVLRLASVMRDFPPHRHIGHEIVYPKGMAPGGSNGKSD